MVICISLLSVRYSVFLAIIYMLVERFHSESLEQKLRYVYICLFTYTYTRSVKYRQLFLYIVRINRSLNVVCNTSKFSICSTCGNNPILFVYDSLLTYKVYVRIKLVYYTRRVLLPYYIFCLNPVPNTIDSPMRFGNLCLTGRGILTVSCRIDADACRK